MFPALVRAPQGRSVLSRSALLSARVLLFFVFCPETHRILGVPHPRDHTVFPVFLPPFFPGGSVFFPPRQQSPQRNGPFSALNRLKGSTVRMGGVWLVGDHPIFSPLILLRIFFPEVFKRNIAECVFYKRSFFFSGTFQLSRGLRPVTYDRRAWDVSLRSNLFLPSPQIPLGHSVEFFPPPSVRIP